MKKFAKILSAGLSALMLISAAGMTAGAVSEKSCNTVSTSVVSSCDLSDQGNIKSLLNRILCGGSCNADSLMGLLKQARECPGGSCGNTTSQSPAASSSESKPTPAKPAEKPQSQTEKPGSQTTEKPQSAAAKPDTSAPADSSFNSAYEEEVIRLVNVERAKYGLPALKKDQGAASVARVRAKEIVQSFSHTRPNGSPCFTAAKELGVSYKAAGENIAYGYADPQKVVTGWMNSEGHRRNILSSSFSKIGVGCYSNGKVLYWSQFFIG